MKTPTDNPFPQWAKPCDIIDSIKNPVCRELTIAICSQLGFTDADDRPEWANRAATEFLRCLFGQYLTQEWYGMGFLLGIIHPLLDENDAIGSTPAIDFVSKFISIAVNENSPEAADFLHGYGDGRSEAKMVTPSNFKEFKKMLQPTHTWKIYMFIAVYWRACIDFKNVRQWRAWLVSIGAFKPGLPEHEDAEIKSIRKLLRRIGVPFRDRGGKPRKRNPTPIRNRKVHG